MSIFSKLIANQYYFNGNGYVRDGLIFMFDGIWNAGRNKHDANAQFIMNLVDGKKYPLHNFVNKYSYNNNNCLTLKSLNNDDFVTELQLKETALTVEILFSISTDNVEELKPFFIISNNTFVTRLNKSKSRIAIVSTRYKEDDYSKLQQYSFMYNISKIQPALKTFAMSKSSLFATTPSVYINGVSIYPPDALWYDSSYTETSESPETFDIKFRSLPNGKDVYIYAIRAYNRQLSDDEISANALLDNNRFNIV
jgi:hypothetical protein